MATITFVNPDGSEEKVTANTGTSLMQVAMDEGIDAILAECGGGCACATCHCYIDERWTETVGPPTEFEEEMLEGTAADRKENSRLSCQVFVTDEMDGLIVHLPEEQ